MYKAFVSSTFVDLKQHREHVIKQLRHSGFSVDPMEDWTSDADEPKQFCVNRVADCDLCILLIGFRRGYVPTSEINSITQLEYAHAIDNGIDVLPFLLDETTDDWPTEYNELDSDPSLIKWRNAVSKRHGIKKFTEEPHSLDVNSALNRWQQKRFERERLSDYLASVRKAAGIIRFLGLPQLKENHDIKIDRLFIEPNFSSSYTSPDVNPAEWPPFTTLLDTIEPESRLIILGDPGTGKSTLVNWLSWILSLNHPNVYSDRLDKCIPLPLILRDLGIAAGATWDTLISAFLEQPIGRHLRRDTFESYLKNGDFIIMLDGLDEIGNLKLRRDLREAVFEGMSHYPKCRWLLTSRIAGYEQVPFHIIAHREFNRVPWNKKSAKTKKGHSKHFKKETIRTDVSYENYEPIASIAYISPFTDTQITSFVKSWYEERESDPSLAAEGARNLITAISADRITSRLARVPNLLTIMALIHRVRARLPHGKALLYNEITQAYLESIDNYRKIQETNDTLQDKRRWLARVGYEIQRQRTSATTREIVVEFEVVKGWICDAMEKSGRAVDASDAGQYLDHIKRRSGLLIERSPGSFAFAHLSFQEYFSAYYLFEQITSRKWARSGEGELGLSRQKLGQFAESILWREVLEFLFELTAAERPDWLEEIIDCCFVNCLKSGQWSGMSFQKMGLLARLVANPHAGIEGRHRETAAQACCHQEIVQQQKLDAFWDYDPEIPRIFMGGDHGTRQRYLKMLSDEAKKLKAKFLILRGTGVTDLAPLEILEDLQVLDLQRTGITDIRPLFKLRNLKKLYIKETKVTPSTIYEIEGVLPQLSVEWE